MEVNHVLVIKTPEIGPPKDWRPNMNKIRGAKQLRFDSDRWYSKEGVTGKDWAGAENKIKFAAPGTKTCITFSAGKGAKAEGLRAHVEYFLIEDRLYQRLTWKDVQEPTHMQLVNTYLNMGDTSGSWAKYGEKTLTNHLEANAAHGAHIKNGNKTVAIWRSTNGTDFYHMELPLEDPNDAAGPTQNARWAVDQAARAAGYRKKARGLRVILEKRLIYWVKEVKLTDAIKEAIGRAL